MDEKLQKELEEIVSAVENDLKQGEDWKKIEAMRVLMPEMDGIIKMGEFLGKAEIAKKVLALNKET